METATFKRRYFKHQLFVRVVYCFQNTTSSVPIFNAVCYFNWREKLWPFIITVTLAPVEYLTVEYSTFKKFGKAIITVNWDFSQTSKQIHSKLKYREKVFGEFQDLPRFPRKMVLYSWTNFDISKPSTNIP